MKASRFDILEIDIDCRISPSLWEEAGQVDDWDFEKAAAFMRAAFGCGYVDALSEPQPGSLCRLHGYQMPRRRAA